MPSAISQVPPHYHASKARSSRASSRSRVGAWWRRMRPLKSADRVGSTRSAA